VRQVLSNIVSNAIKFTLAGGVPSARSSLSAVGEEVFLHAKDNGKGIPEAFLDKFMRLFVQVANADVRSEVASVLAYLFARRWLRL